MEFPFKIDTKKDKNASKLILSAFSFTANTSDNKPQEVKLNIDGKIKTFTVRVVR